jgi:hypothetical protein
MVNSRRSFLAGLLAALAGASAPKPAIAALTAHATVRNKAPRPVDRPPIVDRSDWGAGAPNGPYRQHGAAWLTIHHTAALWTGGNTAHHLRVIQDFHQGPERGWVDVAYHFLIDQDGTAYEGRPIWAAPDSATEYDPVGHLTICLLGNFDVQQPTREQVEGTVAVAAWLIADHGLSISAIRGHRDWAATSCPGGAVARLLADHSLADRISDRLRRTSSG